MIRRRVSGAVAVLALWAGAAAAQEAGGLAIAQDMSGIDPAAFSQAAALPTQMMGGPLYQAPAEVRAANPARDRQTRHQDAIARVRGDAGFLAGFQGGQPLAASRQPPPEFLPPEFPPVTLVEAPFVVNNFGSAVNIDLDQGKMTANGQQTALPASVPAITNVDSNVNVAIGTGNVAKQTITIAR